MGHLDLEGSDFRSQDFLSDTEAEELELWGTKEEVGGRAGWNTWSDVSARVKAQPGGGLQLRTQSLGRLTAIMVRLSLMLQPSDRLLTLPSLP